RRVALMRAMLRRLTRAACISVHAPDGSHSYVAIFFILVLPNTAYLAHGFHHRLSRYMPRFGLTPSPGLPIRHFHSPLCQLRPQQRIDPLMRTQSHHLVGQVTVSTALLVLEVSPLVTN